MKDDHSILLIGPYHPYPSIMRFVGCLERELAAHMTVRVMRPQPVLGRLARGAVRKWAGCMDQFLIFPRVLKAEREKSSLVQLCDQSVSIYTRQLRGKAHLLNCHDLIAVRAARGEFPDARPGWLGRRLQGAILQGVKNSRHAVCLSESTREDVVRLAGLSREVVSVIPMGLHFPFARMEGAAAREVTGRFIPGRPFLLHVGGNQWYKNRAGVLAIYRELLQVVADAPDLVLIGEPLPKDLQRWIRAHDLSGRIFCISSATDRELCAFYSQAAALVFPSLHEGFGWPVIEAQACGCPVVTSKRAPMNAIGGAAAVYIDPEHSPDAARAIQALLAEPSATAAARQEAGFQNAARFSTGAMISSYLDLYSRLMAGRENGERSAAAFA